jgi:septum formation protein
LEQLGLQFSIRSSSYEEIIDNSRPAAEMPSYLAEQKAESLRETILENELLITADTLVMLNDVILGKPKDEEDAFNMIRSLSGKWHEVITGICLMTTEKQISFAETTEVHFKELSDEEISHYIEHYQPMDKAGAYGIQEWIGLVAVNEIKGCFFNVIGLPVPRFCKELEAF